MAPSTDQVDELLPDEQEGKAAAERRIGQVVAGTYRIARYIGSGGSSHVYEAEHVRLGKPFAVKLLRPELGNGRKTAQRFRREAKAIARLQNEHIISVIDSGELEDQTPYLVMELLQGEDLRSLLEREGRLPARRAVRIAIEACRGLREVHKAGLVHRDLKPENLFIARRSTGEDWCKVLDFGVAKMEASQSTAQGAIIGTVRYMAPEQLSDSTKVGPATDVYAVGAILYECLAGATLIEGDSVQQVMYRVMNVAPTPLTSLRPELPDALLELIEQCVAKAPAERPQSVDELARALQSSLTVETAVGGETTVAEDSSIGTPLPLRRAPKPGKLSLPLAAAALLLAGALGWLLRGPGAPAKTDAGPKPAAMARLSPAPAQLGSNPFVAQVSGPVAAEPSAPSASSAAVATSSRPLQRFPEPQRTPLPTRPAARAPEGQSTPVGRFDDANPYDQ